MKALFFLLLFFIATTSLAQSVKPSAKLLSPQTQDSCKCHTKKEMGDYIQRIKQRLMIDCDSCDFENETLLIYDAKCRKFLYRNDNKLALLNDLDDFRLKYKKPFWFKIVNLNRYLYNVNLANSDVVFTSTQSQVMQQNLIATPNAGQVEPPNTFAAGGSGNQGDNIFSIIQSFRPNIDRIILELQVMLQLPRTLDSTSQAVINELTVLKNDLTRGVKNVKLDNMYNDRLDKLAKDIIATQSNFAKTNQPTVSDPAKAISNFKNNLLPSLNAYIKKANSIVQEIDNSKSALLKDAKFYDFKTNVNKLQSSYQQSIQLLTNTTPTPTKVDSSLFNAATVLKLRFDELGHYYNHFIETKLTAYSVCTDSFPCCGSGDSTLNYQYFDSLLSRISAAYAEVRKARSSQQNVPKPPVVAAKPAPAPKHGSVMFNATNSDIVFENGKIKGVMLQQVNEPDKPQKPEPPDPKDAAIKAIDSPWFLFERSISPDYIMRQLLFRRNLTAANLSYTSPPIYPFGDRLGLVFKILASDSAKRNGVILDHVTTESLDFIVSGKPMFSFSAGTFFAVGKKLASAGYEFQQTPALGGNTVQPNSPYKLIATGKGGAPIGIDGLANVTWRARLSKKFDAHLGFSGGVAAIIQPSIRIAYLFGSTISVGTYQQFHFTIGLAGLSVDELKDSYRANPDLLYTSAPTSSLYSQKIKSGIFASVSYTIFNLKSSGPGKTNLLTTGN